MSRRPRKTKTPEPPIELAKSERAGFPLRWIVAVLIAAAAVFGSPYGLAWLRAAAVAEPASRISVESIRLEPLPAGIRGDLVRAALRKAGIADDALSLADPLLPKRLAEAFDASPWIRSARVRRQGRGFEVAVDYRKPVLSLPWWPRLACYVAADGVVLPVPRELTRDAPGEPVAEQESLRNCLALEGMQEERVPAVGSKFEDQRIADAARFASLLGGAREKLDLIKVVATSPREKPFACELGTLKGSIIRWGAVEWPEKSDQIEKRIALLTQKADGRFRLDPPDGPTVYEFDEKGTGVRARSRWDSGTR